MSANGMAFVVGLLLLVAVFDLALRPPEKRHRPLWIPLVATLLYLGGLVGLAYWIAR